MDRPQGNGLAVASLVLGIVGAVFGIIPLTAVVALICGVLAVVFGIVGWRKSSKTGAPHRGMAIAGFILGAIAVALGIVGLVIIGQTVSELERIGEEFGT